ncbi:hypothetical protein MTR67_039116 [Solanum verrucosum]|uniref:AIR12 DOMON domain-containing protein n=1 Tax=Solanum verrucosum TaxID=315347 RepID=A0AAF0UHQ8_SOLVR|nr:hypothetical protein MTR67_039116 [Solanum verrucosum]
MIVNTYNLTSYKSITQTDKLSFKVLISKAEYSNGVMQILATLVLPSNMTTVNQVWQVGPAVKDSTPVEHKFDLDNLKSTGTLNLTISSGGMEKRPQLLFPLVVVDKVIIKRVDLQEFRFLFKKKRGGRR